MTQFLELIMFLLVKNWNSYQKFILLKNENEPFKKLNVYVEYYIISDLLSVYFCSVSCAIFASTATLTRGSHC